MPRQRTWGDGSIYQRKSDGRWVGSLVLGERPDSTLDRRVAYGTSRADVRQIYRNLRMAAWIVPHLVAMVPLPERHHCGFTSHPTTH